MAKLLLFAAAREAAGCRAATIRAGSVGEALEQACERFGPSFRHILPSCVILVDSQTLRPEQAWSQPVEEGTEITVLPPVAGGQGSADGALRMADVSPKPETRREAVAVCRLVGPPSVSEGLVSGTVRKGDAVGAATTAGVLAAKRAADLIPLCHPVRTTFIGIEITLGTPGEVRVRATVRGTDRTGFEMEALTACAVAALTLYDMGKAHDPALRIEGLRIVRKAGGASASPEGAP